MIIQIDQSGKLEKTNVPTAIGFANGKADAVVITAAQKLELKRHFRAIGKRRAYIYKSFAALIFLLLKGEKPLDLVIIDTEYPGQEPLIKSHLLNFFRDAGRSDVGKASFIFKQIGKASRAHDTAYAAFKRQIKFRAVSTKTLTKLVN